MMRISFLMLALASLTFAAQAAPPQPTAKEHPILGRWVITLPDGSCSETYTFRPDGTTLVTSAEEIAETVFEISAKPAGVIGGNFVHRAFGRHRCFPDLSVQLLLS